MITIIKTLQITLCLLLVATTATSCKNDNNIPEGDNTGKTGAFTIEGVNYTGKTTIQTFSNENYSVVCEQDEPYKFIQITFHNKAEAEAGGTFKVENYTMNVKSGTVTIGTLDIITSNPVGNYTISVSGKKITINNVKIKSTSSSTNTTINSASINF